MNALRTEKLRRDPASGLPGPGPPGEGATVGKEKAHDVFELISLEAGVQLEAANPQGGEEIP